MEVFHCLRILCQTASLGNTVVVLSGEGSSCKWGEDGSAQQLGLEKPPVLDLHVPPFENVVLGLLDHWFDQVVFLAGVEGLSDLILAPLAGPPVEGQSLANDPVEGPADLLHRGGRIASVAIDHIHVVEGQVLEGFPHALDHVLSAQPPRVWDRICSMVQLCSQHVVMPWNLESPQGFSKLPLSLAKTWIGVKVP